MAYQPVERNEVVGKLEAAIAKIRTLGVDIERGRVKTYLDTLRNPDATMEQASIAVHESEDLCEGLLSVSLDQLEKVRHKLPRLCGGPLLATAHSPNDPGRDLVFELATAAFLANCGVSPELEAPTDVSCATKHGRLSIECKRPRGRSGLFNALRDSFKQISDFRRTGMVGLAAVSIDASLIAVPDNKTFQVRNTRIGREGMDARGLAMLASCRPEIQRFRRNARQDAMVTAFMFRYTARVLLGADSPTSFRSWRVESNVSIYAPDFRALYDVLSGSPIFEPGVHTVDRNDPRLAHPGPTWFPRTSD